MRFTQSAIVLRIDLAFQLGSKPLPNCLRFKIVIPDDGILASRTAPAQVPRGLQLKGQHLQLCSSHLHNCKAWLINTL